MTKWLGYSHHFWFGMHPVARRGQPQEKPFQTTHSCDFQVSKRSIKIWKFQYCRDKSTCSHCATKRLPAYNCTQLIDIHTDSDSTALFHQKYWNFANSKNSEVRIIKNCGRAFLPANSYKFVMIITVRDVSGFVRLFYFLSKNIIFRICSKIIHNFWPIILNFTWISCKFYIKIYFSSKT